jgi:multidrug transporter EmrE-like cation transporter
MNIFYTIPAFAWLLLSVAFFATGEYFSKKFALGPSWKYVAMILAAYISGTLAWLPAILQKNQLSVTGTIWSVLSVLATIGIGLLIFKEHLNAMQITGLIFAIAALALLNYR